MSKRSPSWSRDEADQIVSALEASGLSVAEFARQHDIDVHRLYWARRCRRLQRSKAGGRSPFTELAVVEDHSVNQAPIELRMPSGISLLVTRDFDEVTLRRVLGVLSRC